MTHSKLGPFTIALAFTFLTCSSPELRPQDERGLEGAAAPDQAPRFDRMTPEAWVVQEIGGAVVNIQAKTSRRARSSIWLDEIFRQPNPHSQGSGVVIGPEGFIITNNHVIAGASEITVAFNEKYDSRRYRAELIDRRPDEDLALLKITRDETNGGAFPYVKLGRSEDLMIGEKVIAIGNPYGKANTVSSGILSAMGREITVQDPTTGRPATFKDLLQTDASINPGNSGGPLLNVHAELIGINNAIMPRAQGISFAIPSDKVTAILSSQFFNVNLSDRFELGFLALEEKGRLIARSLDPEGSAAAAGMRDGDRILSLDGAKAVNLQGFSRAIMAHRPGDRIVLGVERGRAKKELSLRLEAFDPREYLWRRFGVELELVSIRDRWNYRYRNLQVREVRSESIAEGLGIEEGDLVLRLGPSKDSIDRRYRPMTSLPELVGYMRTPAAAEGTNIRLWISILRPGNGKYYSGDFEI